jgi:hypothetical protein
MAMTKNFNYSGPDFPYQSILPPSLNFRFNVKEKKIPAYADTADLTAGLLCYHTGTTQDADMTECPAEYGSNDQQGLIYAVALQESHPSFAKTVDKPVFPMRIPKATDVSGSLSDYKYEANDPIEVIKLEIGMYVWLLIGNDATADVTEGYTYFPIASGYVGAQGDPDGTAIAKKAHGFTAIATFTNMNWALFRYEGIVPFDDTN